MNVGTTSPPSPRSSSTRKRVRQNSPRNTKRRKIAAIGPADTYSAVPQQNAPPTVLRPTPVERPPAPNYRACLRRELGQTCKVLFDLCESTVVIEQNGRMPSLEDLETAFTTVATDPKYTWDYVIDGCMARAHVVCADLNAWGINHFKVFLSGQLQASSPIYKSETMDMHVAVAVLANDAGNTTLRIIDPAFCDKPSNVGAWIKALTGNPVIIDAARPAQYHLPNPRLQETRFDAFLQTATQDLAKQAEEHAFWKSVVLDSGTSSDSESE